jgi:hypothetical protein
MKLNEPTEYEMSVAPTCGLAVCLGTRGSPRCDCFIDFVYVRAPVAEAEIMQL